MLTKDKLTETLLSELKEECLMILSLLNQLETPGISENQEDEILGELPVLLIWKYTPEKPRNRLRPKEQMGRESLILIVLGVFRRVSAFSTKANLEATS